MIGKSLQGQNPKSSQRAYRDRSSPNTGHQFFQNELKLSGDSSVWRTVG
jgi:hypothetical protein